MATHGDASTPIAAGMTTPKEKSSPAALDKTLALLEQRDDTSRFVGLALLKSLLDNHEELRNDVGVVSRCLEAVSAPFLDRLLRSGEKAGRSGDDARNMTDLAVSVIHTFTLLQQTSGGIDEKLIGRTAALVAALDRCSPETASRILETLLSFQGAAKGPYVLLHTETLLPLLKLVSTQRLALDVVEYAIRYGTRNVELHRQLRNIINSLISTIVEQFANKDNSSLLNFMVQVLPIAPAELRVSLKVLEGALPWLSSVTSQLQSVFLSSASTTARGNSTLLASILLQALPEQFPPLFFGGKGGQQSKMTKPFLFHFMSCLTIDLRASFPSLLELLASPEYKGLSRRLEADFNVLCAALGFLAQGMDDPQAPLPMEPDEVLKIQRWCSETSSLTMEWLRDRWDAAVAGTAGLHPDARPGPGKAQPKDAPLSLTWDSLEGGPGRDPLTLAAVRYLALWLGEDDNERSRQDAAGIMDVLLGLFSWTDDKAAADTQALDYKTPVLMALEGIITSENGIDAFLREDGWSTVSGNLSAILARLRGENSEPVSEADMRQAIAAVRVLFAVTQSEAVAGRTSVDWAELVRAIAALTPPLASKLRQADVQALELCVSSYQLAASLFEHCPTSARARYTFEMGLIMGKAGRLLESQSAEPTTPLGVQLDAAREVVSWIGDLAK